MPRQSIFRIADCTVRLRDETGACFPDIDKLIRLYAGAEGDNADLRFDIVSREGKLLFLRNGREQVWSTDIPGEIVAAFEIQLYTQIASLLHPRLLSLHAASVAVNGRALLFAGISNAGKSSLCTAGLLDGAGYLTDEFSLLGESGDIHPFPRPLQWGKAKHPAFSHRNMQKAGFTAGEFSFPDYRGEQITSHLWFPPLIERQPLPLAAIFFPAYSPDAPAANATPMRRSEALMQLPQHLHLQQAPDVMLHELNRRLPNELPFFRLDFSEARAAWNLARQYIA